ncbi:hypothetical protein HHL11_04710 [Ramlibacter sp. G-1-2-2]|uniref:Lipoprotein n=1 Tax=Ramlibacter agri TaxID=2728837 RepID=A0A848H085_9BURK|nr:hypothetical protein [Ramlibacter agri]NML43041.1 hypothetical protein [Ramlibacter agri]
MAKPLPGRAVRIALAGLLAAGIMACAMQVPVTPAQLQPLASGAGEDMELAQATEVRFTTGYTRVLPAGSHWRAVGTLPQGTVFKPLDTVFQVEGRQVHEAWLVLRGAQLQGFYLPGESHFTPALLPMNLSRGEKR